MKKLVIMTMLIAGMTMLARAEYVTPPEGLRLRKEPSLDAKIIRVLPFGTQVEGIVSAGWMKTDDGYLKAEYLSENDPLSEMTFMGEWRLTAYYETGYATASGVYPEVNVTLAHNSLPFGTQVYFEDLGIWTVQDRGPAHLGTEWADLYLGDYGTCVQFGERTAKAYIIKSP